MPWLHPEGVEAAVVVQVDLAPLAGIKPLNDRLIPIHIT
jgi:hypothetical protein